MKKFIKHFGFAILMLIVLLIIGYAPNGLNKSNPTIAASMFYNVIWAFFGAHLTDRIVKW